MKKIERKERIDEIMKRKACKKFEEMECPNQGIKRMGEIRK